MIDAKGNAISVDTTKAMVAGQESEIDGLRPVADPRSNRSWPASARSTAAGSDRDRDRSADGPDPGAGELADGEPQQRPGIIVEPVTARCLRLRTRPSTCPMSPARPSRRSPLPAPCRTMSSRPPPNSTSRPTSRLRKEDQRRGVPRLRDAQRRPDSSSLEQHRCGRDRPETRRRALRLLGRSFRIRKADRRRAPG